MLSNVLDVFNSDPFTMVSLTKSIELLPYVPGRIGAMGLFADNGIVTTTATIEEDNGTLALVPVTRRGTPGTLNKATKRTARSLSVPRLCLDDAVMADDVKGVREFGSVDGLQSVVSLVNNKLARMKQNLEVTLEYHRVGAIQGKVLDSDGATTLYNLFTEFGVVEQSQSMELDQAGTDVPALCIAAKRLVENALGNMPYSGIRAFCGDEFFDAFIAHSTVKDAYKYATTNAWMRADNRGGFEFGGIVWENYRGSVGNTAFVPTAEARLVPIGVPGLFETVYAPADYVEAVNTVGLPIYAKQERMEFDRGVKIEAQKNPLCLCYKPRALVKLTKT